MFGVCECWPTLLLLDVSVIRHRVIFEGIFQGEKSAYRKYGNISPGVCQIKDYLLRNLDKWSWHLFPQENTKSIECNATDLLKFFPQHVQNTNGCWKVLNSIFGHLIRFGEMGWTMGFSEPNLFLPSYPPNMCKIWRSAEKCLTKPRK